MTWEPHVRGAGRPDFLLQRSQGTGTLALALGLLAAPSPVLDTKLVASPLPRPHSRPAWRPSPHAARVFALALALAGAVSVGSSRGRAQAPDSADAGTDAEPTPATAPDAAAPADADADADAPREYNPLFDDPPPPPPRTQPVRTEEDEDFETLPEVEDPWVMQVAARTGLGFGLAFGDLPRELVWDSHLRAEIMFTHRGDEHFSVGPSMEIRGADMDTFEVAAGISALLPIARGYPLDVSAQVGYAIRRGQRHGGSAPIFVGTLAGGYRSFNFHHWWQTSLQLYAQVRMDITEPRNLQFMMGVEIDFAQAVIVPALMIRMKVRGGDPEELDQDEDGIPDAEEEDDEESDDSDED
jgi:hypothetical protein